MCDVCRVVCKFSRYACVVIVICVIIICMFIIKCVCLHESVLSAMCMDECLRMCMYICVYVCDECMCTCVSVYLCICYVCLVTCYSNSDLFMRFEFDNGRFGFVSL